MPSNSVLAHTPPPGTHHPPPPALLPRSAVFLSQFQNLSQASCPIHIPP